MFQIFIKTRGKLIRLGDGRTVRTPRKLIVKENELKSVLGSLMVNCIPESEYEVTEIDDADVPKEKTQSKRYKYHNDSVNIDLNAQITQRYGR
jgi:hypothetical protein